MSSADYDLAGFAVGAAERDALLPRSDIGEGDVLLGLASSGPHSNGYSLIRKIVALEELAWDANAPFSPNQSLGEALLTPTRIYVRALLAALRNSNGIKALCHITGGGFTENIPRVLPGDCAAEIDLGALAPPSVFSWLVKAGGIEEHEMLRTFNCGIGMIAVVAEKEAEAVADILRSEGETVTLIGRLTSLDKTPVTFKGRLRWQADQD